MKYSLSRRMFRGAALCALSTLLIGCQTTTTPPTTGATAPTTATRGVWQPLSYEEAVQLTSGYSYRVRGEQNGRIYYVSPNGKFLRFDPNADISPPEYLDGGRIFKDVLPEHVVGNRTQTVDGLCSRAELSERYLEACHTFIQKDNVIYLYGDERFPLEFKKGNDLLADRVAQRAGWIGDTATLRVAAREFPGSQTVAAALSKSAAHDGRVREMNDRERARQAAEAQARAQSNSNSSGGLVGWALVAGLDALSSAAASGAGSGNAMTTTTPAASQAPATGISRSGDGWVSRDGTQIGRVTFSYGEYRITCSRGYNDGWGSNSAFGSSFKIEAQNRDEATAVLARACK